MTERRKEFDIEPALVPQDLGRSGRGMPGKGSAAASAIGSRGCATAAACLRTGTNRVRSLAGDQTGKRTAYRWHRGGLHFSRWLACILECRKGTRKPCHRRRRFRKKSIAVLPFENLSEDKANAYFADGIQDEILTRLSKIADLKVISRTSTQHYKSAPENLPEIARQLGVAHILEGSVQKSGDAVRVNVQLIKAANDSHLWADTFDRKLTDIFSVESEVAKAIADQLRAKLTGQEEQVIAAKPTDNPEAYDAYLRGLAYTLKTDNHTRQRPWRTEISQRSGAVGPEVRP